jgi:methylmalonyl-CoA mutase N-terminal domain/subunit
MGEAEKSSEFKKELNSWEKKVKAKPELLDAEGKKYLTDSGIPVKPLYTPKDLEAIGFDYSKNLGFPGGFPFTRGNREAGYREGGIRAKQYIGYGSAEETNELYKNMIKQGNQTISIAYDLPTQSGYDSDDPRVAGEVGKIGVPVCSLKDWEIIFDGINLEKVRVDSVCNAQASVALAWHISMAEKQGANLASLTGLTQNDILKEYIARGNYIFPPEPSMRLAADMIVYSRGKVPSYTPLYFCPYHIREAGSNAVQEIAFALSNAIAYIDCVLQRGLPVDDIASRMSCLITGRHRDFMEEIAKLRAIRFLWTKILKERYGAKNPESFKLRMWDYEGGIGFTREQPEINIARAAIAAVVGAMAGVEDLGLCTMDETLGVPGQKSLTIALRTTQIVMNETGISNVVDPMGGSYYLESLTHEIATRAEKIIEEVDRLGGMVRAIELGFPQGEIAQSAHNYQKRIDSGEYPIVAQNMFRSEEAQEIRAFYRSKESMIERHMQRLKQLKKERNNQKVQSTLDALKRVAEKPAGNENNLMPPIIDAVQAYATVGEICGVLREVFGEYQEITGV